MVFTEANPRLFILLQVAVTVVPKAMLYVPFIQSPLQEDAERSRPVVNNVTYCRLDTAAPNGLIVNY